MKTEHVFLKKIAKTAIVPFVVFAIASCGNGVGSNFSSGDRSPDAEANVEAPSMDIHTAAFMGDLRTVEQHVRAGTDLDQKDEYGSTPLMIAVTFNKPSMVRVLIEAGADVNCTNDDGSTPLHTAAFLCRTEMVEILLENGADRNIRNNFGSTALESILVPFESVIEVYDQFSRDLGPLGLKLDYDRIRNARPDIAGMLQ